MWLLLLINFAGKIAALTVARVAPATALALPFVPDGVLAYHLFVFRARGLVHMHRRFRTPEREVWLTIDDGPDARDTPRILELLSAHDARATFFVIGENVTAHPEIVRAIVAAGHEVAHHTQTHPLKSFWCASPVRLAAELDGCLAALAAVSVRPTRFRPPAGLKNLWLERALAARQLVCIGWSARGRESWRDDVAAVAERVTRDLAPGAILLLHEGPRLPAEIRVRAIGEVLGRLRQQGYRCVVPKAGQLA